MSFRNLVTLTSLLLAASAASAEQMHAFRDLGYVVHAPDDWKMLGASDVGYYQHISFALPGPSGQVNRTIVSMSANRGMASIDDFPKVEEVPPGGREFRFGGYVGTLWPPTPGPHGSGGNNTLVVHHFEGGIGYSIDLSSPPERFQLDLPKFQGFLSALEFTTPIPLPSSRQFTRYDESLGRALAFGPRDTYFEGGIEVSGKLVVSSERKTGCAVLCARFYPDDASNSRLPKVVDGASVYALDFIALTWPREALAKGYPDAELGQLFGSLSPTQDYVVPATLRLRWLTVEIICDRADYWASVDALRPERHLARREAPAEEQGC